MADLRVTLCGVPLQSPVIAASGTFGFGQEFSRIVDMRWLGAISGKGLTLEGKAGNEGERLYETPAGLINSIGLQNPGVRHFIQHELPAMKRLGPAAMANLGGSTIETYEEGARLLDGTEHFLPEREGRGHCLRHQGGKRPRGGGARARMHPKTPGGKAEPQRGKLKISGAIIVSTPQKIALADVRRGIGMFRAKQINIPVLGIVENMAWFTPAELPANRYYIFGKGGAQELARSENIPLLAEIPLIQSVREAADAGTPVATQESTSAAFYTGLAKNLVTELEKTGH